MLKVYFSSNKYFNFLLGNRPSPPDVRITPSSVVVREGEPIELRCVAEGFPYPRLTWTRLHEQQLNYRVKKRITESD